MKFVYICSPLKGDIEGNISRAFVYCRFAAQQSVVPLAPHVMFAGFLDDAIQEERSYGMRMGLELLKLCSEVWVFGKRISEGMLNEISMAAELGIPVKYFDERCERIDLSSKL